MTSLLSLGNKMTESSIDTEKSTVFLNTLSLHTEFFVFSKPTAFHNMFPVNTCILYT